MKPKELKLKIKLFYLFSFLCGISGYILTYYGTRVGNLIFLVLGAIFLIAMPTLSYKAAEKEGLLRKMLKTITKLDADSLNILDSFKQNHGLMTVRPTWLNNLTIRHLLELDVLSVEVFPSSDHGYYLTDVGRYLLNKELEFKELFPEILCQMLMIGFWQSYNKFNQKKEEFKKRFKISWDKCAKMLENMLIEKGIKATDNIIEMFNNYCKEKIFNSIMNEIVIPWKCQVNKERIKFRGHIT